MTFINKLINTAKINFAIFEEKDQIIPLTAHNLVIDHTWTTRTSWFIKNNSSLVTKKVTTHFELLLLQGVCCLVIFTWFLDDPFSLFPTCYADDSIVSTTLLTDSKVDGSSIKQPNNVIWDYLFNAPLPLTTRTVILYGVVPYICSSIVSLGIAYALGYHFPWLF